jgi:hypothetical protein
LKAEWGGGIEVVPFKNGKYVHARAPIFKIEIWASGGWRGRPLDLTDDARMMLEDAGSLGWHRSTHPLIHASNQSITQHLKRNLKSTHTADGGGLAMPTARLSAAAAAAPRSRSKSRASHCPFLILLFCLLQLAARFPAALAFVVGLSASRGESSSHTCHAFR